MKLYDIFQNVQTDKKTKKIVYFCPYCSAVGWSGSPNHFEGHVITKHNKQVKANECVTSALDRYLEREKFELLV